jgi:hypothetical protein
MLRTFGRLAGQFAQDALGCGGWGKTSFSQPAAGEGGKPRKNACIMRGEAGASQDYGRSCVGCSSSLEPHSLGKTEVSI